MFENNKNLIISTLFVAMLFLAPSSAGASVKNTVSATASSGGNKISGSGTIKTGDASATVEAKNYVNGGEDVENKAEARAEGNEASVSINGEEKSCIAENGESCQVEIENSSASAGESVAGVQAPETEKNAADDDKNIFVRIAEKIMDKIGEWLI